MSREFLLVLGGGVVSLATTLVVLFITDWIYRRDQARGREVEPRAQVHGETPSEAVEDKG